MNDSAKVKLRPYEPADFKHLESWLQNNELMRQMDMGPFTAEEISAWPTEGKVVLMVEDRDSSEVVGFVNFYSFTTENSSCKRGTLIDPKWQGRGYGKTAVRDSNQWAFTNLDINKIIAYTTGENSRSKNNLLSSGMTYDYFSEAKQRHYFYQDK